MYYTDMLDVIIVVILVVVGTMLRMVCTVA